MCVFWIYGCFAYILRLVFESLICCLDLWLSSLLVAFIFMCFSSLEIFLFFKLDSSSIDSFLSSFSFSFLDRSLTYSQSIVEFSCALCLLDSIPTTSRSIKFSEFVLDRILTTSQSIKISGFLLNTFSIAFSIYRANFLCYLSAR